MIKYLIGIPTMDTMVLPFVASLTYMQRVGMSRVTFLSNSLVYEARNMLAAEAIDTGAERVLWLDSDMCFGVDLMQRLAARLDEGLDFVTGLYFRRLLPTQPILAKTLERTSTGKCIKEVYDDYPKDSLFEIAASGFGVTMCTTKMLKDVYDHFGKPFEPMPNIGEDFSFCYRARQLGYKLYCDSSIKADHVGLFCYGEHNYNGGISNGSA